MREKTVMEVFGEMAEKNRAEVASMEKSMTARLKEKEGELARVRADLGKERSLWGKMRDEYAVLEGEIEAEVRRGLKENEIAKEKALSGEVSFTEFSKTHLNEEQIRQRVQAAAREKLSAGAELLRRKSARLYELEAQEAALAYEIAFAVHSTPSLRLAQLKREAEDFQRLLNPLADGLYHASKVNEEAKQNLCHVQKGHVFNIIWDSLIVPEIKNLLFDARIPPELRPSIEEFLGGADSALNYSGIFKCVVGMEGGSPYIGFRALGPR
jgi:hypothetical protein